jgi:hypothetical protein
MMVYSMRLVLFKEPNWVCVFLPHLRNETDPVSETLCFLVSRIQNDGKNKRTSNSECYIPSSEPFRTNRETSINDRKIVHITTKTKTTATTITTTTTTTTTTSTTNNNNNQLFMCRVNIHKANYRKSTVQI